MDDLVRSLLDDLSHNLDRLADRLAQDRPRLARTLRYESWRAAPMAAERAVWPRVSRAGLRPLLYRALDAGALDEPAFDRLMVVAARARRSSTNDVAK